MPRFLGVSAWSSTTVHYASFGPGTDLSGRWRFQAAGQCWSSATPSLRIARGLHRAARRQGATTAGGDLAGCGAIDRGGPLSTPRTTGTASSYESRSAARDTGKPEMDSGVGQPTRWPPRPAGGGRKLQQRPLRPDECDHAPRADRVGLSLSQRPIRRV